MQGDWWRGTYRYETEEQDTVPEPEKKYITDTNMIYNNEFQVGTNNIFFPLTTEKENVAVDSAQIRDFLNASN